jgi:hypothetical protein
MTSPGRRKRSRRLALFALALLSTVGLSWLLVPATIIPPVAPDHPVSIYVMDTGIHARLLLPQGERWMQYGFGDWTYYARSQQTLAHGLQALLWPTPAAVGWGEVRSMESLQRFAAAGEINLLSFEVSLARVQHLQRLLANHFQRQRAAGSVYNPYNQLTLVKDDRSYSLLHNSNHALAAWLAILDCKVLHLGLWTSFRLAHPRVSPQLYSRRHRVRTFPSAT